MEVLEAEEGAPAILGLNFVFMSSFDRTIPELST